MRALVLAVVCTAFPALAWPVDWVHEIEPGKEKFLKLPKVDWFEVDDPKVVAVEWNAESNELLLIALKPGRALVLLGADGKVAAWRVRVGGAPRVEPTAFTAAQKACPELKATPLEDVKLTVTVATEACRQALLTLFQTDAFEARHLELSFEGQALQGQLRSLQDGLAALKVGKVTARYVGAGLVLDGAVASEAEHRKVLWEVLRRTVGRFSLSDGIDVPVAPGVDSGVP